MATKAITRYRTRFVSRPRRRSRSAFTVPVAPIAGALIAFQTPIEKMMQGQWGVALEGIAYRTTPYNPWSKKFDIGGLRQSLPPMIGGMLIHKLVGQYLGVNRALGRAKVPLFRI